MDIEERIHQVETGILREPIRDRRDLPPIPLSDEMRQLGVPGVGIAVIEDGAIQWARGYGLRDAGQTEPVTPETMFQAGSISKPVTAVAVMRLVQEGRLDLDRDVNDYLRSWKVPPTGDWQPRITLRQLLSHSAGTTVHGFPGYNRKDSVPSVTQVLDGEPPANTPSVRVAWLPGTQFRYSGGGTTIVQLLLSDLLDMPFPQLMRDLVLAPLEMQNSTYVQPLPEGFWDRAATGHRSSAVPVDGKWHVYPEMAAAGLWTTPSDLARLAIDVQRAWRGESGTLLREDTVREMLSSQVEKHIGIGFFLEGGGEGGPESDVHERSHTAAIRFGHGGSDEGFIAGLTAYRGSGRGAVVMTNGDWGSFVVGDVLLTIARTYDWADYPPPACTRIHGEPSRAAAYAGMYRLDSGATLRIGARDGGLWLQVDEQQPLALYPASTTTYFAGTLNVDVTFTTSNDAVTGLELRQGSAVKTAQRVE